MLLSIFWLMGGCGQKSAEKPANVEQAIAQAITQLEVYSGSRTVTLWGHPTLSPKEVAGGQNEYQKILQTSEAQDKAFKESLDNLKQYADREAANNREAKWSAFAKWLAGAMLLYRGELVISEIGLTDARHIDVKDRVRQTCVEIEQIKSQEKLIGREHYTEVIGQSQTVIAELKKKQDITQSKMALLTTAIEKLNGQLADLTRQRDNLASRIGVLTAKLGTVSAKEGVGVQKQINRLEDERFKIVVAMEKLSSGPMDLPKDLPVTIDNEPLKTIGGLHQLTQEKARLQARLQGIQDGIKAQESYLKSVEQQVRISDQKKQQLTQRLDVLVPRLKEQLTALDEVVSQRGRLVSQAKGDIQLSSRYAQQADSDLKRFLGAVSEAANARSGVEDNYLNELKGLDVLSFSIGYVQASAQLDLAKIMADTLVYTRALAPILQQSKSCAALPAGLLTFVQESADTEKKIKEDLPMMVDRVVNQYQSLYNKASRGNLQPVIGTHLASILFEASILLPDQSAKYISQAKELLAKIIPPPAAGMAESQDPLLAPAKKLRQVMGI